MLDSARSHRSRLWFSVYTLAPYPGQGEPAFYPEGGFAWTAPFAAHLPAIQQELQAYLRTAVPRKHYGNSVVSEQGAWSSIPLVTWGLTYHRQLSRFPETARALQQIDGLVSASFSLLKAGTSIHPHYGDTNAIIRSHFGVDVPAGLPQVGFRVNGEERAWRNGEFLFFCDGYVHSAWNHSEKDRIVMIIDVLRPEFAARRRFICATVLASLTLQMMVSRARPLWGILLLPFFLTEALLSICAYGLSPVFNVLSKIFGGKGRGLGRNQRPEENIPER